MNHIQFEAAEARINQILTDQLISIDNMEATKPGIDVNEIETMLWNINKKLIERIVRLDPNESGQDDERNQLKNIQSVLNEAHSEVFTYDQNRSKGKYNK